MTKIREEVGLSFDDVLLVPQKGKVKSRNDVDLATHLGGDFWLRNPVVASPMSTVCDSVLARRLSELGGIGIIHRFMSVEDQVSHYKKATKPNDVTAMGIVNDGYRANDHWAGCAVGISDKNAKKKTGTYDRIKALHKAGCRLFAVDIAHGFSDNTSRFMELLPNDISHSCTFISGSVATAGAARFCYETGFDTIRVGIGNGAACSTRRETGVGVPQLTALMEISEELEGVKSKNGTPVRLISCGGIRHGSDAVKAIAAGASTIILGSYLAGCNESPLPGKYYGEASVEAQDSSKKDVKYIEGESGTVKTTGSLEATLAPLLSGIRSGISYSGASSIVGLQENAEFIITAPGVANETAVRLER